MLLEPLVAYPRAASDDTDAGLEAPDMGGMGVGWVLPNAGEDVRDDVVLFPLVAAQF